MKRAKISIVGAGNVGATTAHWCAAAELGDIVLLGYSADGNHAPGQGPRPGPGRPDRGLRRPKSVGTTSYDDTAGSDVVVITAGVPRKPGMSRDDLLSTNARIVGAVAQQSGKPAPRRLSSWSAIRWTRWSSGRGRSPASRRSA